MPIGRFEESAPTPPGCGPTIKRVLAAILAVGSLASACGSSGDSVSSLAADVTDSPGLSEAIGTTIVDSQVVGLACIPSRTDPVGVFINLHIVDARLGDEVFQLQLAATDTRLGSHPSGCHDPDLVLAQSVFLLSSEDDTVLADRSSTAAGITTLEFDLDGHDPDQLAAVLFPTVSYAAGDGERETASYGLVGMFLLS